MNIWKIKSSLYFFFFIQRKSRMWYFALTLNESNIEESSYSKHRTPQILSLRGWVTRGTLNGNWTNDNIFFIFSDTSHLLASSPPPPNFKPQNPFFLFPFPFSFPLVSPTQHQHSHSPLRRSVIDSCKNLFYFLLFFSFRFPSFPVFTPPPLSPSFPFYLFLILAFFSPSLSKPKWGRKEKKKRRKKERNFLFFGGERDMNREIFSFEFFFSKLF